jgi:hypothetical protein
MKRFVLFVVASALLLGGVGQTKAGNISGPTALPYTGSGDSDWGIQFNALQNVTLTGFDYNHLPVSGPSPFSGTISVKDLTTSSTIFSTPYGTGEPTVIAFTGLNISLTAGNTYQLLATSDIQFGTRDEVIQYISLNSPAFTYPVSNTDISVTNGVFSDTNTGFGATSVWYAFQNIETSALATPEPSTFLMASLAAGAFSGIIWLRRRKPTVA